MQFKTKKDELSDKDKIKELKSNDSSCDFEIDDKNNYYKRFKDNDSYNDYIINMDFIIGVRPSISSFEKYIKK